MKIREVNEDKKQFIALLLLADEQENMIDRYLEKGTMYVLEDGDVKAECVVTDEGNEILEIKNIAVDPENQGKGYGKALIDFLASKYADEYSALQVGTGDSPLTIPFYEKCGFVRSHKIPNFFTDNYDHPIYECGVQLIEISIILSPELIRRFRRRLVISMPPIAKSTRFRRVVPTQSLTESKAGDNLLV